MNSRIDWGQPTYEIERDEYGLPVKVIETIHGIEYDLTPSCFEHDPPESVKRTYIYTDFNRFPEAILNDLKSDFACILLEDNPAFHFFESRELLSVYPDDAPWFFWLNVKPTGQSCLISHKNRKEIKRRSQNCFCKSCLQLRRELKRKHRTR